ncbi:MULTISPECIES: hypothetical protein [Yersinia pseudotuberculosis complex]
MYYFTGVFLARHGDRVYCVLCPKPWQFY